MALRLSRHDLVWLSGRGWDHALANAHDDDQASSLDYWRAQRLPLVVTRQSPDTPELALGLALPLDWDRRKWALHVPRDAVLYHDRFPRAAVVARQLSRRWRPRWAQLCGSIAQCGVDARVHGSYGWQTLSGLAYVTARSDMDLLLPVADADVADRVVSVLQSFVWRGPRIDGELLFANGAAVAWREWAQWREGIVDRLLVKRSHGVALESARQFERGAAEHA